MNNQTDSQLLHDYAENRSEAAFTELMRRHVDLVYSAARRMVCDPHLAEDVTQGVFVAFAKNARQLTDRSVFSGWLHRTAQNIAAQTIRTIERRRAREQEAVAMNELLANEPDVAWENIAPHLDVALGELSEQDRDALLLRYFERKSAREMAAVLNVSEEAAQKRVNRAVERLRELFSKRKVTIGASGLVVLISTNAVQAAPVALIATISSVVSLIGTATQTSTSIAATKTIAMTTLQKTLIATALVVATGTGIYEARQNSILRDAVRITRGEQAPLQSAFGQLKSEYEKATNQLALAQEENEQLRRNIAELPKLRAEVARLGKDSRDLAQIKATDQSDPTQVAMKSWLARLTQLKQRMEELPQQNIPELQLIGEQDWLNAARGKLETEEDYRRAMSTLRGTAENKVANLLQPALKKYIDANEGKFPTALSQLQPFFTSPVDPAILERYGIFPSEEMPGVRMGGDWIITVKAPIDEGFDSRFAVGPNGFGIDGGGWRPNPETGLKTAELASIIKTLSSPLTDYKDAHNGKEPPDASQLQPYLKTPQQKAALEKLIQALSAAKGDGK